MSLCALIVMALFLTVHWRYKIESFSIFMFPLVFVMTLVATMGRPVAVWSSPAIRSVWLITHIVLVLLGYAALLLTAVSAVGFLVPRPGAARETPPGVSYQHPPPCPLVQAVAATIA